jgi:hypothetical protein
MIINPSPSRLRGSVWKELILLTAALHQLEDAIRHPLAAAPLTLKLSGQLAAPGS